MIPCFTPHHCLNPESPKCSLPQILQIPNLPLCYLSQMLYLIFLLQTESHIYKVKIQIYCSSGSSNSSHRDLKIKCLSRVPDSCTKILFFTLYFKICMLLHESFMFHMVFPWLEFFPLLFNIHSTYLSAIPDSINLSQNPSSTWCLLHIPFCTLSILPFYLS